MTQSEMFERSFQRPRDFFHRTPANQWGIDANLGILDWEGGPLTKEELQRFHDHYSTGTKKTNKTILGGSDDE